MRTAQDSCIKLECASTCAIEGCTFTNIGGYAVWLHLDCRNNRILRNTVTDAGAGGVLLTSGTVGWGNSLLDPRPAAARYAPIENTISDNHIHHCGVIRKYVSGVHLDFRPKAMAGAPGNLVSHNHIHDMPRLGIFAFAHQGGNVFEFNHIHHVMLESDDGGGIHINTAVDYATAETQVRNNLIHDILGPKVGADGSDRRAYGFGIYLDGATSNCVLANNVVYNTSSGAVFLNGGRNNVVENNILAGDGVRQIWVNDYRQEMTGTRIRRNIFYALGTEAQTIMLTRPTPRSVEECENNLFWLGGRPVTIDPTGPLSEWQKKGFDTHSLVADPLFADAPRGDYSLKPDSPALKLEFHMIETRHIGPRPVDGR
jgi:parallel beta-helix repeat protein